MDETENYSDDLESGVAGFAALDTDAAEPSEEKKRKPSKVEDEADTTDTEEQESTDEDEAEGDDEESTDDSDEDEGEVDKAKDDKTDELVVKVTVDGEEREFSVASLKRLAGQEASLTRKSQEVATQRQQVEHTAKVHVTALDKMLERAKAQYEPYSKIDFLALSRDPNIPTEQITALRDMATAAYENVKFIEQDLGHFSRDMQEREHAALVAQAKASLETLKDPEQGIPGFNETVYAEMRKYALDSGIPAQVVDRTVDALSLKLLHKAMLYDRAQKQVKTNTDKKVPKKIVKSTTTPDEVRKVSKEKQTNKAFKRLYESGTQDDAVDAFAERFSSKRDDD